MKYSTFFVLVPFLFLFLVLGHPLTAYPQTTLTVEDMEDVTGRCTSVDVSLAHTVEARGIQLDICDTGDHLVALGCRPAARVPAGYSCTTNELDNGCASIILFPSSQPILPGEGPVLTVDYGVFWDAPSTDLPYTPEDDTYSQLIPNGVRVADGNGDPLPSVETLPGSFHFLAAECTHDDDCPDDGIFCNGVEVCQTGDCVLTECPVGTYCDEDLDECRAPCSSPQDCDDGLFCTGGEACEYVAAVGGDYCAPGVIPCGDPAPLCDEINDRCVECLGDSECDDGLFCTGAETCVAGFCQTEPPPCLQSSICDEDNDACLCTSNAECDDGLFCNGVETCSNGTCNLDFDYLSDYPCLNCRPNQDDCDCDDVSNACVPVTLTVGDGSGLPGSTGNVVPVSLDTLFVDVNTIQMDVCDGDDTLICTGCDVAGRTPGTFTCSFNEQPDGCCRITFIDITDGVIEPGTGPVLTINYDVLPGAPAGECRPIEARNVALAAMQVTQAVDAVPGNFCFSAGGAQASFAASSSELTAAPAGDSTLDPANQTGSETNTPAKYLKRMLFGSTGSDDNPFPFVISETCPFATSLDDPEELATLRDFRDKVLSKNVSGIIFTFLFYRNAPELTRLLGQHEELQAKVGSMVTEYSSLINDLTNGGTASLLASDRAGIIELLEEIKAKGSPQLAADIDLVIEEIKEGAIEELIGVATGE